MLKIEAPDLPDLPDYLIPMGPVFEGLQGKPSRVVQWHNEVWIVVVPYVGGPWITSLKIGVIDG